MCGSDGSVVVLVLTVYHDEYVCERERRNRDPNDDRFDEVDGRRMAICFCYFLVSSSRQSHQQEELEKTSSLRRETEKLERMRVMVIKALSFLFSNLFLILSQTTLITLLLSSS